MSLLSAIVLELSNLCCERADRYLFRDLSEQLQAGDIVEVRGANGAGKSTLLRIAAGLAQDFEGQVSWQGVSVAECTQEFHASSLYFGHRSAIKPGLTAAENLLWLSQLKGQGDKALVEQALERMHLGAYQNITCHRLSAGQQRRVALARLLTVRAKLWILDEPFTALDAAGLELVSQMLIEHASEGGAVLIASHHALADAPHLRVLEL